MKNIAIISPTNLPIPATKGGAVETGIQQIIDENEQKKEVNIDIFSYYEELASQESQAYKFTKFNYYKESNMERFKGFIKKGLNFIIRKLGINYRMNMRKGYTNFIKKIVKEKQYEVILVKNAVDLVLPIHSVTNSKICLQLHNDFLNKNTYKNKKIVNACDRIITNSEYIKRCVLTIEEAKNKRVLINKNCIELEQFCNVTEGQKKELIKKYNINKNEKIILFSGRMIPQKGIKELLYAVDKLPRDINWKLYIIGSKWFSKNTRDSFQREVTEIAKKLDNKVKFIGYVPYKEIPVWDKISSLIVFPSIWEEPAGRVAIEAQAAGTPLIISDAGGIKEYVTENSAIVVKRNFDFVDNLANQILRVLEDKNLQEKMSKAGVNNSKNYTKAHYYEEIMEELGVKE